MGYHQAGFDVVGVDLHPQPRYPFEVHQADALAWMDDCDRWVDFDAIHASPVCKAHTELGKLHPDIEHMAVVL